MGLYHHDDRVCPVFPCICSRVVLTTNEKGTKANGDKAVRALVLAFDLGMASAPLSARAQGINLIDELHPVTTSVFHVIVSSIVPIILEDNPMVYGTVITIL
jgi:hypothetical protein